MTGLFAKAVILAIGVLVAGIAWKRSKDDISARGLLLPVPVFFAAMTAGTVAAGHGGWCRVVVVLAYVVMWACLGVMGKRYFSRFFGS